MVFTRISMGDFPWAFAVSFREGTQWPAWVSHNSGGPEGPHKFPAENDNIHILKPEIAHGSKASYGWNTSFQIGMAYIIQESC